LGEQRVAGAPVRRRWADPRALAALLLGTALLLACMGLVLSHTSERRSGTNGVWLTPEVPGVKVPARTPVCQDREVLAAGTAALRIPLRYAHGPATVTVQRDGVVLDRVRAAIETAGRSQEGWLRASIARPPHDLGGVEVCFSARSPVVVPLGAPPPDVGTVRVGRLAFRTAFRIDYLQPARRSWWAEAPTIAHRLGLGRGDWGGDWIAVLIAALVVCSLALTARVVLATIVADRRAAGVAATIAAVAASNALVWALITPTFQVPDEVSHVAYVQRIGETGGPPRDPRHTLLSREELAAMARSRFGSIQELSLINI
jgi:hypothetical protein